ncbi:PLAC8 family protein [Rhynchospora pubera]|uniref:PLAC8 family protein n=1 Tax=Rhynchospora pubera TaxID=906938 RepID=A0AAV8GV56_9POAL|nr:PLAC8 family protein [Rhynchospora pubera]
MRKINWASFLEILKEWCENPMNIALFIWLLCVAVSGSMLILLLLGALNTAFPTRVSRNYWIEINNQVLNALFTLMSVYQHPSLFHHLFLLLRWGSEDVIELRKFYCKNGSYRPHELAHIAVVVSLLHVTCFCQYMLCGLYWGYSRQLRPEWAENLFFILGTATPVIAAVYTICSPLGKEYDSDLDEEAKTERGPKSLLENWVVVSKPEWVGGLFDCGDDRTVGFLSCFCTFCVFGWNMERLGFGNMYVHIITFLLLCVAPFWIFSISALHIHNYVIGDIAGVAGIVLCAFGLIYGGYWRIQMRKKFKLPGNTICCGSASMTDYLKWMFCWGCALAQEVRTGNFYDVEDDNFYRKLVEENCEVVIENVPVGSEPSDLGERGEGSTHIMDAPIQPLI